MTTHFEAGDQVIVDETLRVTVIRYLPSKAAYAVETGSGSMIVAWDRLAAAE